MINCAAIKAAVAAHYGIPLRDLDSRSMIAEHAQPRQVAMALSRQLIPCLSPRGNQGPHISLCRIGYRFHRDHTTVLHAVREVAKRRKSDPTLRRSMRRLTVELLRGQE